VQVILDPLQAPLHERNFQPFAGVAVNRTGLKDGKLAVQPGRQVIPGVELVTAPFPATDTLSRKDAGAKSADTVVPAPTVTMHPALPEQPPPQRTSLAPAAGIARSERRCPEFHVVVQVDAHWRPGTSADTDPGPEIVKASGTCPSAWTSQAESCVSAQPPECP
jgi:hypothetical protein